MREFRLARRAVELPGLGHFQLESVPTPSPGPGQVLVRNSWMIVTAAMRTLMGTADVPLPMYEVGRALHGPALGQVVESAAGDLPPGSWVRHRYGWRDFTVADAAELHPIPAVDGPAEAVAELGQSLTAYVGLRVAAPVRPGETVLVTGAGGAIGSVAVQLARLLGATRVIGTAGSEAKVIRTTGSEATAIRTAQSEPTTIPTAESVPTAIRTTGSEATAIRTTGSEATAIRTAGSEATAIRTAGSEATVNGADAVVRRDDLGRLREAAPDGVDVVFDTVGGSQLTAAVDLTRPGARIAVCGALAHQLGGEPARAGIDVMTMISRRVTLRGFTASDHPELEPEWRRERDRWLADGALRLPYTLVEGLVSAPQALLDLVAGRHAGTVVVRV